MSLSFFIGLHQPSDCRHFKNSFVSVNRLRKRKGGFEVKDWIMDSGAFTEISTHGCYRHGVEEYVHQIERFRKNGNLLRAVTQDWMCEPFILEKTRKSLEEHQELTVDRWLQIQALTSMPVMPVLQGFAPETYIRCLDLYGKALRPGMWVGVGSVCKRNKNPHEILSVLKGIKARRPDIRLHGFGLKTTALKSKPVRKLLFSADSMAWSFRARIEGRNQNDWREAKKFENEILSHCHQDLLD